MGWAVHEASMYYKFLKKDQLLLFADECIEEADKMINKQAVAWTDMPFARSSYMKELLSFIFFYRNNIGY